MHYDTEMDIPYIHYSIELDIVFITAAYTECQDVESPVCFNTTVLTAVLLWVCDIFLSLSYLTSYT